MERTGSKQRARAMRRAGAVVFAMFLLAGSATEALAVMHGATGTAGLTDSVKEAAGTRTIDLGDAGDVTDASIGDVEDLSELSSDGSVAGVLSTLPESDLALLPPRVKDQMLELDLRTKGLRDLDTPGDGFAGGYDGEDQEEPGGGAGDEATDAVDDATRDANGGTAHGGPNGQEAADDRRARLGAGTSFENLASAYGAAAARSLATAAGRAIKVAGPLAPPLTMAMVALGMLFGIGRAPENLVKIEHALPAARRFKL